MLGKPFRGKPAGDTPALISAVLLGATLLAILYWAGLATPAKFCDFTAFSSWSPR